MVQPGALDAELQEFLKQHSAPPQPPGRKSRQIADTRFSQGAPIGHDFMRAVSPDPSGESASSAAGPPVSTKRRVSQMQADSEVLFMDLTNCDNADDDANAAGDRFRKGRRAARRRAQHRSMSDEEDGSEFSRPAFNDGDNDNDNDNDGDGNLD